MDINMVRNEQKCFYYNEKVKVFFNKKWVSGIIIGFSGEGIYQVRLKKFKYLKLIRGPYQKLDFHVFYAIDIIRNNK